MRNDKDILEEFDAHVNGLRRLLPPNDGGDTPEAFFGYKTRRGIEIFSIVDWGNVRSFLIKALKQQERAHTKELEELDRKWRERVKDIIGEDKEPRAKMVVFDSRKLASKEDYDQAELNRLEVLACDLINSEKAEQRKKINQLLEEHE